MSSDGKRVEELSKTAVKRKYLLTDEDLEDVDYEMRDNPLNKSYAPMKVFKQCEVEKAAIMKWGSLEKLDEEQEARKKRHCSQVEKKEKEMRKLWDLEEIHEPMKSFMGDIDLPKKRDTLKGKDNSDKNLLNHDVIMCYCDCMHSRPPGAMGKSIYKMFPSASKVDKSTPYNDRRKLGHYSWTIDTNQLIVNLYIVHKWNFKSKSQANFPILNYDALALALKRLSAALLNKWRNNSDEEFNLCVGTYVPYREDPELFKKTIEESFELPLNIVSYEDFKPQTES